MNKNKFLSYLFIVLNLIIGIASVYVLVSYAIEVVQAVEDFIKLNNLSKLSQCGATLPPQFSNISADSKIIVPVLFYGLPILLLVVSVLMFFAGYYYNRGRIQEEKKKREEIEREIVVKAAERVAKRKSVEEVPEEPEPEEEVVEEPEEEKTSKKKKKK
jgi:hypothetical protein